MDLNFDGMVDDETNELAQIADGAVRRLDDPDDRLGDDDDDIGEGEPEEI